MHELCPPSPTGPCSAPPSAITSVPQLCFRDLALAVSSQVAGTHPEFKKKKKNPETIRGVALTLWSQSPAEHRCGVGTGPLGSVRMGTSNSQAEQRPHAAFKGKSCSLTLTAPPQQATPTSALCGRGAKAGKHGPLDRRVLKGAFPAQRS